jgi:hypothetical protein
MTTYKQRTLDYLDIEWATYIERFNRWPADYGAQRVRDQGYEQFRDMLAHILAWWEEAMPIILAIAEDREFERKKYDFDAFNAAAVAKYKTWDEQEFLARFEETRRAAAADLRSMNEAAWDNRRVRTWINGVFISHAREHLVALSRFLAADTLANEWSEYIERFKKLEDKNEFLKKQGFESLHDLLAHVIGWWDEGERIIGSVQKDSNFKADDIDADKYNAELVEKYKNISEADVQAEFENKRQRYSKLVDELPEDAFLNQEIETWLALDVVGHFDEHGIR